MNGNWWSVIGQGFDFAGFTILSLDLYRDYSRYKRRDDYRFAVLAYEQAKQTRTKLETPRSRNRRCPCRCGQSNCTS